MSLTRDQANDMQVALIKEYVKDDFQSALRAAFRAAAGDLVAQGKARQELCLPIQGPIISRYGFEPSRKGVFQSTRAFTPELQADPEFAVGTSLLAWLTSPDMQAQGIDHFKPKAQDIDEDTGAGRLWEVTGGRGRGGIIVRTGPSTASPECSGRLATGTRVRQVDGLEGERLHYEKVSGDGPDSGWVSVASRGTPLAICLDA